MGSKHLTAKQLALLTFRGQEAVGPANNSSANHKRQNNGEILEDMKSLEDQKVENDAVVALTLRKGTVLECGSVCFIFLSVALSVS
ncbi:hypothetical protein SAY86_026289 [Trapa natans]|uniref:Uncharacterized protein n=1 Tax=Trapa natans TaxID=22666 RepID=A0AAN7QEM1_TRANT|nr:hypothetical protein SAY86_026289 [Trapa natans]